MRTLSMLLLLIALVLPAQAQEAAKDLVQGLYRDYQAAETWQKTLPGQNDRLGTELFEMLNECVDNGPQDGFWLDFDPFTNAQMNAASILVDAPKLKGSLWYVPVRMSYRVPGNEQLALYAVVGDNQNGQPRILNLVYPARDGAESWDLKSFLKKGLGK